MNDIIPYRKGDKWGFCTSKKEIIIPCRYDDAKIFANGVAQVKISDKWGFCNEAGIQVIPCVFERVYKFTNGLALVNYNGKYGFIDSYGNQRIECKYDHAEPFSEGLAKVQMNEKVGYLDVNGKLVIDCKYKVAHAFNKNMALVGYENFGDVGFVNRNGIEIIKPKYSYAGGGNGGLRINEDIFFSEGLVSLGFIEEGGTIGSAKFGFMDMSGEVAIPFDYESAGMFSEGLAAVCIREKYGFINTKGVIVIECLYERSQAFSEGLAGVRLNGKWGYINKMGEVVIPFRFAQCMHFNEGIAGVRMLINEGNYYDYARRFGKWGYIDKNGNFISPCVFDYAITPDPCQDNPPSYAIPFSNGVTFVNSNNKWAILSNVGELVTAPIFDKILFYGSYPFAFYNDLARVGIKGLGEGYVNKKGTQFWDD